MHFFLSSKLILFIRVRSRNNNLVKNIWCSQINIMWCCRRIVQFFLYKDWLVVWFGYCNAACCNVLRHTQQHHHQTKRFLSFSFLFSSVRSLRCAATLFLQKRLLLPHCYFVVYQLLMLILIKNHKLFLLISTTYAHSLYLYGFSFKRCSLIWFDLPIKSSFNIFFCTFAA